MTMRDWNTNPPPADLDTLSADELHSLKEHRRAAVERSPAYKAERKAELLRLAKLREAEAAKYREEAAKL